MAQEISSVRELIARLRSGQYSSVGSYPLYFVTADCEVLSFAAVRENLWLVARATRARSRGQHFDREWCVTHCEVNWENADLFCAHSGERIESAYAESG